jgi:hypothetical protein
MIIEQTIEVPADHRLLLEIPATIPRGKAKIALHITPFEANPGESKRLAFQSFMKFRKAAPSDFDYKKELTEALDEKHGCIG